MQLVLLVLSFVLALLAGYDVPTTRWNLLAFAFAAFVAADLCPLIFK